MKYLSKETVVRVALILFSIVLFLLIFSVIKQDDTTIKEDQLETVEAESIYTCATVPSIQESFEVETYQEIVLVDTPVLFLEITYVEPILPSEAAERLNSVDNAITSLETECLSESYSEYAVFEMRAEIDRLIEIKLQLQSDITKFTRWETEYYYATHVWYFLRSRGYSKEVSAGIIGNMMVETAGSTLALKPTIYDKNRAYYGLCQWSLYYRPNVRDKSFEDQLIYLDEDMAKEFKTFGFCYKKDFTYENFLQLSMPEDAAIAFAKVYERCASGSYNLRASCARKAYDYFVNP